MKISIKYKVLSIKQLLIGFLILTTYYLLPTTNTYAQVDIRSVYPFAQNPNTQTLGGTVRLLVVPTFSVAGVLVIFYFLVGAFRYLISKGDKNEVEAARNMMTHAIIGFIILIFAFFIMQYLTETFGIPGII